MSELCVDASVIVKLALSGESHRSSARRLVREAVRSGVALVAPPFFANEVDSVIRRRAYDGRLSRDSALKAYVVLDRAPVRIVTHPDARSRAREIAEQFNQSTVYDACYAALAELRGCEFWTADKIFYNSVHLTLGFVRYLPDYP